MAKIKIKKWWITRDGSNSSVIKELTFKEADEASLKCKFNWDNKESAERYSSYLATKGGVE